jgi:hypothetical protein
MRRLDETHQNWKCDSALLRRRTLLKNNHWNHINLFSSKTRISTYDTQRRYQ